MANKIEIKNISSTSRSPSLVVDRERWESLSDDEKQDEVAKIFAEQVLFMWDEQAINVKDTLTDGNYER